MGSNYIATDATINFSRRCIHDSTTGYSADFTKNGEVDGWEYFDGIHTYGCWSGFLFGTIYDDPSVSTTFGTIGRFEVFRSVNATTHYFLRIVMKYNPWPRDDRGYHPLPTRAKVRWRTLQSTNWDEDKELYFDIEADNNWHTYVVNMGVAQFWQGDINDLRLWPVVENGEDGDEFFIRAIDIFSSESHECRNTTCERFNDYSYPCPWIGKPATIESLPHSDNKIFQIDSLTPFIININGYGEEIVKIKELKSANGRELANHLAKAVSRTNVGGYAEVQIGYTDDNTFKIQTGNTHEDASIEIIDNDLARYLNFFASNGVDVATYTAGETPVNGFSPLSSFKIKTHQALGLLDNDKRTAITFNPFQYSVEGGRRDWLTSSTGLNTNAVGAQDGDYSGQPVRKYTLLVNAGKTVVEYNHPFNASGRIKKIWLQGTLDHPNYVKTSQETGTSPPGEGPPAGTRKGDELSGARVMVVRPQRDGNLKVIYEWNLNDRDPNRSYDTELYSISQEGVDIDVDVFVNKGDMLAAYNINLYIGKSVSGEEVDAQFYQIEGKPEVGEVFDPKRLYGDGSGGLLFYAHGEDPQKRLYLDIDLGNRYNIENIEVKGEALNSVLEYNIARCLDINWEVDLFGLDHLTHHTRIDLPGDFWYVRPNTYYGLENLSDGIYNVPDGLACDSFSLTYDLSGANWNPAAGPGVIPTNPHYFWVNGDEEWLAVWLHATYIHGKQSVHDFDHDQIAIYMHFPHEKEKKIYKSKIYFKEKYNFRSFGISTYGGFYYTLGDADDLHYDLVPEYTKIVLDNVEFEKGGVGYEGLEPYLFQNPCTGHPILEPTSEVIYEWDPVYSDAIKDFSGRSGYGQESGYFSTQNFSAVNAASYLTSNKTDWQIIEHQWDPIVCKGWRMYCDYHESTKITEFELYGIAEDIGSNLSGGIVMTFSDYQEIWWPTESTQKSSTDVEVYIGDSPRYFTLELIPVTETRYDDIVFNVKTEDIHAGTKGCEYTFYTEDAKIDMPGEGMPVTVKNVYRSPYDLYIDISPGKLLEAGMLYYSPLNTRDSILNPPLGVDSKYYKLDDYTMVNQDYNCAINCHTYGLKNLIDGAQAHYSYNDMQIWTEWGELSHGQSIGFENLPTSSRTQVVLPHLSRSRYWKFGLIDPNTTINVREMRVYDNYDNLLDPEFYHDLDKTFEEGDVSQRAPHLENDSIVGSYYTLAGDQYITMDLGAQKTLGRVELWHDGRSDYEVFYRTIIPYSGIDKYTKMCLRSWKDNTGAYLQDVSYYEHEVQLHGTAHIDTGEDESNVSISVDLGCMTNLSEWSIKDNYGYPKDLTPEGTWFSPVSASGTVTSGTCEFPGYVDFNCRCHAIGNDRFYYDLREDSAEAYKVFQQLPFELTFAIQIDDYYPGGRDGEGGTYTDLPPQLSVGLINGRRRLASDYFSGAQMYFDPKQGRFGLAVRTNPPFTIGYYGVSSPNLMTHTYTTGLTMGTKYYCKLTCYGGDNDHRDTDSITYRAQAWVDATGIHYDEERTNVTSMTHAVSSILNGAAVNVSDGSDATYWQTNITTDQWLSIDLGTSEPMYKVLIEPLTTGYSARLPKNFRVEASNNNVDWDIIHTDITVQNDDPQEFTFSTVSAAYRYWRIYIIDNWGDGLLLIGRFELYSFVYEEGLDLVADLTRNTNYYWEADNIAIGSGNLANRSYDPSGGVEGCGSVKGTVYDLKFNLNHDVKHYPFRDEELVNNEKCSIRIPAGSNNYVRVKNSTAIDIRARKHTHDFWVKFRTLPPPGTRWTIMEQYDYDTSNGAKHGWRVALYCAGDGSYYRWEWWVNRGSANGYQWSLEEYNGQTGYSRYVNHFNIVKDKWYFMVFSTGPRTGGTGFFRYAFFDISGRATFDDSYPGNPAVLYDMPGGSDIYIGKEFDGWICEPRISRGDNDLTSDAGGERYNSSSIGYGNQWESPIKTYTRMYPFAFYVSDNNLFYGHYANVDAQFPVDNSTYLPYLYYNADNEFAEKYNSYFAIDFGYRRDIDLVRRYGAKDDHLIDIAANVIYSNIDTDDPYEAFMTEPSFDTDDNFYGWGGEPLNRDRWWISTPAIGNETKYLSMYNGRLEHRVDSDLPETRFYSTFGIRGDFDIEVKCGKISAPSTFNWWAIFRVDFSNELRSDYNDDTSSETYVNSRMEYKSDTSSPYYRAKVIFSDGGSTYSSHTALSNNDVGLRIIRENDHFYVRYYDNGQWHELDDRPIYDATGKDVTKIHFGLACDNLYPTAKIYWRNFKINYADKIVMRSTNNDARWMAIEMLNGDSVTRYLKKLGIYPDITNFVCPDNYNYNASWVDLGPSVTGYSTGTNIALGKNVTASSFIGQYWPLHATDGIINNERSNAWLSDNNSEQWLLIDLEEEKEIYRVKVYHGYSANDSDFLATNYTISSSMDGVSFTNRWDISSNSSFERTHDVADPFTARYIRVYINSYRADNSFHIKMADLVNFYDWKGACMREIEVYEYYGYSYVSSEEWPIIAINLRDQFYIQGHSMLGLYAENTETDWSNDSSNYAWSDSVEQDPKKVSFSTFGTAADYEQWAVIKRDTATYYNITPTPPGEPVPPYGVDYLKHILIESTTKENPIDYPWWWSSTISTVSRDFSKPVIMGTSSLRIDYPASSSLDTVQFIEGSNWGVDSDFAYRDGLFFRLYIDDVEALDTEEGYFFFGGLDGTNVPAPVVYRWNLSTLSGGGVLETGWNSPFLKMKDADEVIYNENADPYSLIRPEIPEYTQWQTFGVVFKGKGQPVGMNIDGFRIKRNHFEDSSKFDFGLYLAGSDYLDVPTSEIDLKAGTIEFWLRPDYSFAGLDTFRRFRNRSLFHLGNVANDAFGFMINSNGFNIYYGNLAHDFRALLVKDVIAGAVDGMFHMAVAFSANGKSLAGDNSSIKLYINGGLVATGYDPWNYTDEKFWKFTVGGKAPLALIENSSSLTTTSVNGVISNLRIYNYCKSDFTDSMNNTFSEDSVDLVVPSKMVEISQDNVTYYKIGDPELPFFYEKVPAGDSVQIYMKSNIPKGLTGKEDRTAGLITSWDIGV